MNRPDPDAMASTAPQQIDPVTSPGAAETRAGDPARVPAGLIPDGIRPERLGGYRIEALLGRGGMGAVYLARDDKLARAIALKTMHRDVAAQPGAAERFLREARAAAQIVHDNVIPILHIGEEGGTPFIAMPLLEGEALDAFLIRTPRPHVSVVLKVARETADGLVAAHARGLVHRDIKPANLWIEGDPTATDPAARFRRVKILDFGLARPAADTQLSHPGMVIGTPAYMSPEQARGHPVDARTDLFSLGVVLYRMTAGCEPFTGDGPLAILTSLAVDHPEPPRAKNPAVPPALSDLIMWSLAKDRDQRPNSAAEVGAAIREIGKQLAAARKATGGGSVPSVAAYPQAVAPTGAPESNPWTELDATEPSEAPRAAPAPAPRKPEEQRVARTAPRRGPHPRVSSAAALGTLLAIAAGVWVVIGLTSQRSQQPPDAQPAAKSEPKGPQPKPPKGATPATRTDPDLDAAEWVRSVGGKVTVRGPNGELTIGPDEPLPGGSFTVTGVSLIGCRGRFGDGDLERLKGCANLTSLNLLNAPVTDAGVKHLRGCANLMHLDLYGTRVSDTGLGHLAGLSKLADVDLRDTTVSADGVHKLQNDLRNCTIKFNPPEP